MKTIAEAASRLKVDEATVKGWLRHGCPGKRGSYDVDAIAAWRAANKKPPRQGGAASELGERAVWERRKVRAEAKLRELSLRAKRGELILVSVAAQIVRRHVAEVTMHLRQLPDYAVAREQLPPAAKERIRDRLRAKVRDLCTAFEKSVRETQAARDDEAAE
ncbi:MAG TPA: hypothetical protein VG826_29160 [Pirellulales bacterium]|nr:hypothetical protein [Pirellulales bacterium]